MRNTIRKFSSVPSLIAAAILVPAVIAVSLSATASRQRTTGGALHASSEASPVSPSVQSIKEMKRRFPKVEYDAPEPADPTEQLKRRKKGKRFDKLGGVSHEPTRYSSGLRNHWEIDLPALPVAQSDAVVVATTLSRAAYLSNDKGAVFTELCISVDEVLKSPNDSLKKNSRIDVNRLGGVVRYRTGEESLLFVNGQNMPTDDKRYLFFLKAIPDSDDFTIITGYELGPSAVTPLDSPSQFAQYNGADVSVFLDTVRRALVEQAN